MKVNYSKLSLSTIQTLLILPILLISVFGIPKNAPQPWNEANSSSLGNVNLFNGVLDFSIPLINIGGRGSTQIPLTLSLNSRWKKYFYSYNQAGPLECPGVVEGGRPIIIGICSPTSTNPDPAKIMIFPRPYNGLEWNTSWEPELAQYNPGLLVGKTMLGKTDECRHPPDYQQKSFKPTATRFYLEFTTSSGSTVELVDQNTYGKFRVNTSSICNQYSSDATFSRGDTFISTNGSAMKFVSDTVIDYDGSTNNSYGVDTAMLMSGYLYTADGSTYRIDEGTISWIKDVNGNKTTFTYYNPASSSQPKRLHTATDSIGRTVTVEYNVQDGSPYGLCDRITYKSLGGEDKTIRISKTNLSNALRSGYTLRSPSQMWPATCDGTCGGNWTPYNPVVSSTIWLPDGGAYKFQYNSFLEVSRIEFPTGAAVEYDHDYPYSQETNYEYSSLARVVKEMRVYSDVSSSGSLQSKTKYSRTIQYSQPSFTTVSVDNTDAYDNLNSRKVSYFYGDPKYGYQPPADGHPYGISSWKDGYEYQTKLFANDGTTLLRRVLNESENRIVPWIENQDQAPNFDTRQTKQIFVSLEDGKALTVLKKTEYDDGGSSDPTYFSHLNVKRTKASNHKILDLNTAQSGEFGTIAGIFSENDLASVSETDYLYNEGYKARHILGLMTETRTMNPVSPTQVLSKSQAILDEQNQYYSMADYGSTVGYEAPTGNYSHLRANATTLRTWVKDTDTWIQTHAQYDNFGNTRKMWDSSGDATRFIETEYSAQYYYAYPTKTIAPAPDPTGTHGTTESSSVSKTYDFWTGRSLTVTDANGQVASVEYDALLRPKKVIPPSGGAISEKEYGDTPGNLYVKTRTQVDSQNWAESIAFFDGLGRVYKTKTKDLQGDVFAEVEYGDRGVKRVSNPYREGEQKLWSKPRYDNAGRVVETYAPAPEGQTGASFGTVEFGISIVPGFVGNYTEATDASGRKARLITNVFGQPIRIDEPTGNNDLGTLENPNQPTFYTHNVKGELTKITQGNPSQPNQPIQNRFFMYDSLGRLIRVKQPEQTPNPNLATAGNPENNQWTAGYSYDIFGNVVKVTDAKGINIINEYDKVGRGTSSCYTKAGIQTAAALCSQLTSAEASLDTPQVDYFYDGKGLGLPQAPAFSRGALTKVTSSVSENRYTSFDNHGRLLTSQQITDGQTYNFSYKYNLSGGLIEETYPSGRVVKNIFDADGGLATVSSKAGNGNQFKTYATGFDYASSGAVKKMMLGNGRWETAQFNERFQLTQIGLGTAPTDKSLFKVDYEYGELSTDGSTVDAAKNVGNIARQTTTIPTTSFVQTYRYDANDRLTEARETTNGSQNWRQTFGYDRFGNRTNFSQIIGTTQLQLNNVNHPTIDQATNRFTTGQGYVYDFNGNLIQDAEGRTFTFNGDDKQIEVKNSSQQIIGTYFYDASGARVKKVTNTETTVFVYDAGGALAAEYSTAAPPAIPQTNYLTTDHLGSPRVITDRQGQVTARRDFMPFGEELGVGVGTRTEALKYSLIGTDRIRQRFTGYEKDDETQLDFAEARMYQNKHGRFTAVDPLLASASLENPQTFNRYTYTGNNPVNYTDPSGLDWCRNSSGGVGFVGENIRCTKKDGETVKGDQIITGGSIGTDDGGSASVGDIIKVNADGSATLVRLSQERSTQVAAETGAEVRAAAEQVMFSNVGISRELISQRPSVSIPGQRPSDYLPAIPSADPDDNPVKEIATIVSIIPVLGTGADLFLAGVNIYEGDYDEAVISILGVTSVGDLLKIGKLGKIGKLTGSPKGGRYGDIVGRPGYEAHHMPADSISPIKKRDGFAIQMETADHRRTSSWGRSNSAQQYRSGIKGLLDNGEWRKAMSREIKDVRRIGGKKYNPAILQMLDYAKGKGYLRK